MDTIYDYTTHEAGVESINILIELKVNDPSKSFTYIKDIYVRYISGTEMITRKLILHPAGVSIVDRMSNQPIQVLQQEDGLQVVFDNAITRCATYKQFVREMFNRRFKSSGVM